MSDRSRHRDRRSYDRDNNENGDYDNKYNDRNYHDRRRSPNSHHRHRHEDSRSYQEQEDYRSNRGGGSRRDRSRSPRRDHHRRRSEYQEYDDHEEYYDDQDDGYNDQPRQPRLDEIPNKTVMVRGLSDSVVEADIVAKLAEANLVPKDIRLMRNKDTGVSRGFAFVEFDQLDDAVHWKQESKGCIYFDDCRATIHFSVPKEQLAQMNGQKYDWTCYKCGVSNFKRRDECFKCGTGREESDANDTGDEISPIPTNCLLFRNLSSRISEPEVLSFLGSLSNVPIKSIRIPKDPVYDCPRGVCYVELHTTTEATQLLAIIGSVDTSGLADIGAPLIMNYGKRNGATLMTSASASNAASVALAAAQWNNTSSTASAPVVNSVVVNGVTYQKFPPPDASKFVLDPTSGFYYDHSTQLYFDSNSGYYYNGLNQQYMYYSVEHETYLPVASGGSSGDKKTKDGSKESKDGSSKSGDKVKTAKKIAKDMEKWAKSLNQKSSSATAASFAPPSNSNSSMSSSLATSSIVHRSSSSSSSSVIDPSPTTRASSETLIDSSNREVEEEEKSSVSMTQFNHKKPPIVVSNPSTSSQQQQQLVSKSSPPSTSNAKKKVVKTKNPFADDDEEDEEHSEKDYFGNESMSSTSMAMAALLQSEEAKLIDEDKLLCLLCKRQFNSKEQLSKHQSISDLHKTNLDTLMKSKFSQDQLDMITTMTGPGAHSSSLKYVDRAAERRKKWPKNEEEVKPSKERERYMKKLAEVQSMASTKSAQEKIDSGNKGSKMLKAMGWKEGQGLGKYSQGRSDIVDVVSKAGSGMSSAIPTPAPVGESYKDAVKRTMAQRYKEMSERK